MPMLPSLAAATIYGGLKVSGYSAYAAGLARFGKSQAKPVTFGIVKTLLGFVAGLLFFVAFGGIAQHASDVLAWLSAAPIRFLVWLLALNLFFKFESSRALVVSATIGTIVSYMLDLAMWALFHTLPGMETPWC